MAKVSKELKNILDMFDEEERLEDDEIETLNIDAKFINNLKENSIYILDERIEGSVLHSLESIILTVIFAIISKCNTFREIDFFMKKHYEWLDKHIKYENGLPSISTIQRTIGFINPKELEEVLVETFKNFLRVNKPLYKDGAFEINDIKTMDGKTANSFDRKTSKNGEIKKMNAMSVYSVKNNYCEATEFISDKTNEIPTGPILLERIQLKDSIVVFDALSTQTDTINYIKGKFGHYVAPVKGNQETLEEQIREYFEDEELYEKAKNENYHKVIEKAHGTCEIREYIFTNDVDWLYKKETWVGLKAIGIAKRTYEKNGKEITDIRYYITDLDAKRVKLISTAIREEWAIENKLHWYLDMVFLEDDSKSFLDNTQKNLNIIRKFCLGILKLFKEQSNLSMNLIRFLISMDFENEIEKVINTLYN